MREGEPLCVDTEFVKYSGVGVKWYFSAHALYEQVHAALMHDTFYQAHVHAKLTCSIYYIVIIRNG